MSLQNHNFSAGTVASVSELDTYVTAIVDADIPFGFDIETGYDGEDQKQGSLRPEVGFIVGFSFSSDGTWARYVPMRHDDTAENLDPAEVAPVLWKLLRTGNCVAHNVLFEMSFLAAYFLEYMPDDPEVQSCRGVIPFKADSMMMAKLLAKYERVSLKELSKTIFNSDQASLDSLVPKMAKNKMDFFRFNYLALTPDVISYACDDAVWCLLLYKYFSKQLPETDFIFNLSKKLTPVLHSMTKTGVVFDWNAWQTKLTEVEAFSALQASEIQRMILERTGDPSAAMTNLNSPAQVGTLFYETLGLPEKRDRKTGNRTTNAKAIASLAAQDPIVAAVIEYKEIRKLISSYLKAYLRDLRYDPAGRVHPGYKQAGTVTGRLSSANPNIQQTPNKASYSCAGVDLDVDLRKYLVAPPGQRVVGFDFAQQEYRVLAGLTQEPSMLATFEDGVDVHKMAASKVFGVPIEDVTDEQRSFGKTFNFAMVYQQGSDATAEQLGVSIPEADEFMAQYFSGFTELTPWMEASIARAREDGYISTYFGRKVPLFEYQSDNAYVYSKGDRLAINAQCQGTGADITLMAMVRANATLKANGLDDKVQMCMSVHDAVYFYADLDVDPVWLAKLLLPSVEVKIPGFPRFVSEWCYGDNFSKDGLTVIDDAELIDVVS